MGLTAGFKRTELGVIPAEWQTIQVGDVCGCIVPGRNKPHRFDGDIPWITTPDLQDGKPVTKSRLGLCISRAEAKSVGSKIVPAKSVLMSCAGELGIVAITKNEIVVNQQLHAFIPTEHIEAEYLLNALSYRKPQIESYGTKTAVPYLNKSACNSILVPLPPRSEQQAIANALSDADALIEALAQLLTKKHQIKQGAMQELLTGQRRLPGFAGEWEVKRLGDVAEIEMGQSPSSANYNVKGNGLPLIQGNADVANRQTIKRIFTTQITKRGKEGDILLSVRAPVGEVARATFDICLGRGVCAIRFANDYLYHALIFLEPSWAKISKGSTFDSVNSSDVGGAMIALPVDPQEQTAIAAVLSDMDADITTLEAKLAKARGVKQGMMQELLTGRIRLLAPRAA